MNDGQKCAIAGPHSNYEVIKSTHVVDATHVLLNVQAYHDTGEILGCGGASGYALSKTNDDIQVAGLANYFTQPTTVLHKFYPLAGSDSSGNLLLYVNSAKSSDMSSMDYAYNQPLVPATVLITTGGGGVAAVTVTNPASVDYTAYTPNMVSSSQYALSAPTLTFGGCSAQPTYTFRRCEQL